MSTRLYCDVCRTTTSLDDVHDQFEQFYVFYGRHGRPGAAHEPAAQPTPFSSVADE
jgi:hypothetical protein